MNFNLNGLFDAPTLYEQYANSPQYADTLSGLFNEDEEERRRRMGLVGYVGNYGQQQTNQNPQVRSGPARPPNQFNMFYY